MSVDIHALSGAYAVDAVDDLERMHFERHLADCAACRAEVYSLREAAAQLAESTPIEPPAQLRQRVLAEIATVRPLPPLVAAAPEVGRSAHRRFPALVAAAAVLIAIGGAGATVWHPWSDAPAQTASPIEQVMLAPDAEPFAGGGADGVELTVTRSNSLDRAVISADGLTALPPGEVYQLWLIEDGVYQPAGFLDDPNKPAVLHGDADSAQSAGITVEASGGATTPTDPIVGAVTFT